MNQKLYLDACSLCRPFDDQTQLRIHLESESVLHIIELAKNGKLIWFSSEALEFELENIDDSEKREKILALLEYTNGIIELDNEIINNALEFTKLGFTKLDALHIASARSEKVDAFLTTDDKLEKIAKKNQQKIGIKVDNPLSWIKNIL